MLEIQSDARITTNGFPLTLIGTKELRIVGNPQIVAFTAASPGRSLNGRSAAAIVVQTPRLRTTVGCRTFAHMPRIRVSVSFQLVPGFMQCELGDLVNRIAAFE